MWLVIGLLDRLARTCWLWRRLGDARLVDCRALDFKTNQCQVTGPRSHLLMRTTTQRSSYSFCLHSSSSCLSVCISPAAASLSLALFWFYSVFISLTFRPSPTREPAYVHAHTHTCTWSLFSVCLCFFFLFLKIFLDVRPSSDSPQRFCLFSLCVTAVKTVLPI